MNGHYEVTINGKTTKHETLTTDLEYRASYIVAQHANGRRVVLKNRNGRSGPFHTASDFEVKK